MVVLYMINFGLVKQLLSTRQPGREPTGKTRVVSTFFETPWLRDDLTDGIYLASFQNCRLANVQDMIDAYPGSAFRAVMKRLSSPNYGTNG
jgi:hypothetical protein